MRRPRSSRVSRASEGSPASSRPTSRHRLGSTDIPTIVNNVETLSTLPWIVNHGGDEYASFGEGNFRGSRLFCLSGRINRPGTYEVELHHPTFRDLLYDPTLGGGIPSGAEIKAFIPGASFPWFFPEQLDIHLDGEELSANGSSLGSGVMVLDSTSCPVRVAWRLVRFFARESCGQCTPCREGTGWLERIMRRIEEGVGRAEDLDLLLDVGDNISPAPFPLAPLPGTDPATVPFPYQQTTICPLGPSAVSPVESSVRRFRDEYLALDIRILVRVRTRNASSPTERARIPSDVSARLAARVGHRREVRSVRIEASTGRGRGRAASDSPRPGESDTNRFGQRLRKGTPPAASSEAWWLPPSTRTHRVPASLSCFGVVQAVADYEDRRGVQAPAEVDAEPLEVIDQVLILPALIRYRCEALGPEEVCADSEVSNIAVSSRRTHMDSRDWVPPASWTI